MLADAEEVGDCEDGERLRNILHDSDILRRERNLDDLCWEKIDELTGMEVFSLDCILGFVVKLKIIERWTALDPQTGREMFRKLVDEIRQKVQEIIKYCFRQRSCEHGIKLFIHVKHDDNGKQH